MNTSQMRVELIRAYPGSRHWKIKVEKMSDSQVVAIYYRMQQRRPRNPKEQ